MYQVSLGKLPEVFSTVVMETCNRHGNDIIDIHTCLTSVRATVSKFEE